MTRAQTSLAVPLLVLGAVLLGAAWWLLQRSGCAGDLKQGLGDVEAALALEGQAFLAHFLGALLLVFGVSVARPFPSKLMQLGAWVAFLPLTYLSFLLLAFSSAGGTWACAR
jgi:hypothetical protein